jgi:ATPase subunit of ABC transporter with duplicated ATPase domains
MVEASTRIEPGSIVGLVGANGCGKSTLLRCISGQREADHGILKVTPNIPVGYLEQTAVAGSKLTIWQEVQSCMTTTQKAAEVATAQKAVEDAAGDNDALMKAAQRFSRTQEAFLIASGADADARTARVLNGLGFASTDWHAAVSALSGGWQMRVALARLLLSPAGGGGSQDGTSKEGGLLLLDEPTNHLDAAAVAWLAGYLNELGQGQSKNTTVLVSHDEVLLRGACNRMLEVRGGQLHTYSGGWDYFLRERAERELRLRSERQSREEEMDKLEGFIRRFGATATKASQAQSRQKQLDKLRVIQEATSGPTTFTAGGAGDAKKMSLKLPPAPRSAKEVVTLKGADIGWEGGPVLLAGVNLTVLRGQRIVVLGPNGAGMWAIRSLNVH